MSKIGTKEHAKLTAEKAKKVLSDGSVRGHKLIGKQKRYFGWVAGGSKEKK